MAKGDITSDERLRKDAGTAVFSDRSNSDFERTTKDGSALSDYERRQLLRKDWVHDILPKPPEISGWHVCWLSTTNSADPIYKRMERGYIPVKVTETPGFRGQFTVEGGEFDGCVSCNEMLLFKIPMQVYQDIMAIQHYDMPNEQEAAIYDRAQGSEVDSEGRSLGQLEGDFDKLGRGLGRTPVFAG